MTRTMSSASVGSAIDTREAHSISCETTVGMPVATESAATTQNGLAERDTHGQIHLADEQQEIGVTHAAVFDQDVTRLREQGAKVLQVVVTSGFD